MKINKFKINPSMLVFIFIIFAVIMGLSMYSSYISQKNATIEMMTHSSQQLSNSIRKASRNTIIGYKLFTHHFREQLTTKLKYLDYLDLHNDLTPQKLSAYAEKESFNAIYILDPAGNQIITNSPEEMPDLPDQPYKMLNQGQITDWGFNILTVPHKNEKRFTVGIHRSKGGTIIGTIPASRVLNVKNVIYINSLLDSIANDSSIEFIALQDSHRVLHKTTEISLSGFREDPIIQKTFQTKSIQYRITQYDGHKILEVLNYLRIFKSQIYVVRIGLNYSPIQKIQKDAFKQASLRLVILILIGFMMLAYSISMQNVKLLQKEKDKITEEVYELQANLRQKEKLSVIGELAAGVAHKIRNPLNAISMTMQRLKSEFKVKQDQTEYNSLIKVLRKEINHISKIINQFLEFSKPPSITKSKTNLNKIINNVLELYKRKIEKKGIELNWYPEKEITVQIDGDKIKQCLINLLENAADATSKNGKINIYLNKNEQNAILKIEDTGKGIKDADLKKIFNLYFTTKTNGTGIGLAEVYRIIDEHEGKIEVDSSPEQGTTFTIKLPIKEA